eukprot:scaffold4836_cov127-Isochrysis_galbana.AAC.4
MVDVFAEFPENPALIPRCQLALWLACEAGDPHAAVKALVDGASVTARNRMGWNALHRACMTGDENVVRALLVSDGVEQALCAADTEGYTPLHIAAGSAHPRVVQRLLDAGASPAAASKQHFTPMHTACRALGETAASQPLLPEREELLFGVLLALLSGGGLLESTDVNGAAAAEALTHQQRGRLLERIRAGHRA